MSTSIIRDGGDGKPRGGRPPGRPPRLNDEMVGEITQLVQAGNYLQTACAAIGLTPKVYYSYIGIGKFIRERAIDEELTYTDPKPEWASEHEWRCYKLLCEVDMASAKSEAHAVMVIRKHFPNQWSAAMTFLERRFPDRWKRRQMLETNTDNATTLDEDALLEDPHAVDLIHDALEVAARAHETDAPAIGPAPEPIIDAVALDAPPDAQPAPETAP